MPLSLAATRNVLRRFRRNRRGAAAVEFALVAPLFFGLLFAIIEVAMVFFASQVLETVTQDSARTIMTGQAQEGKYTQQTFKDDVVCPKISVMFDCKNGIYVDVQSYPESRRSPSPTRSPPAFRGAQQFRSRRGRGYRGGAPVLQVADLHHQAWLQHREFERGQAIVDGDRGLQERALCDRKRTMTAAKIVSRLPGAVAEASPVIAAVSPPSSSR